MAKSTKCYRQGSTLVEFAFVLPIIFALFLGMVELSRVMLLQHSIDTAAYEGARNAMVPGATSSDAINSAEMLLQAARLRTATISVEPSVIVESTPTVTVRIELPVAENSWVPAFWFTKGKVVSEVTLITERPPMVQLTGIPALKAKSTKAKTNSIL